MNKTFFIIWADPKFYQTLIFLSKKINTKNNKVIIISRNTKNTEDIIKKVNFGRNVEILNNPLLINNSLNLINYICFMLYVFFNFIKHNPSSVIFFNKKALFTAYLIKFIKRNTTFIYHNFDYDLKKNIKNIKVKTLIFLENYISKFCDILVFPSFERGKIFKNVTQNFSSKIYTFMNCFPKNFKVKKRHDFKKFLKIKNLNNKKIICHLGSIGPHHHIENIIESFKYVKKNIILIIAGKSNGNFSKYLQKKIIRNKAENNIFILEDVSNNYWFDILHNSNLGLCFYENINLSHKYMAGTSQKFNNYLCFNIPMIVNDNFDFKKFNKNRNIYEMINPKNTKRLANKINYILKNNSRTMKIKKNMKKVFNNELNFERQYDLSYGKFLS